MGVLGAGGKMGSLVCQTIHEAPDMILVAAIGSGESRDPLRQASVLVDFTHPDFVMDNIRWGVTHGVHMVVGTSGLDDGRLAKVRTWLDDVPGIGVMVVPNFSISAVLAMNFAAKAARHFDSVEIIDFAHRSKAEAPSSIALRTAQMVAAARDRVGRPLAPDDGRLAMEGGRGASVGGVLIHSIRLEGLVSHQKLLLSRHGETLTIRFDTLDRAAFMPGVLLAVRAVSAMPGLTVGLERLLDVET